MTTLIPKYDVGGTGAVNRPINLKLAETVSVKDFGAVGDGATDDTAAVQAAVTYCIANNKDLIVDGQCLLTASVNIDRLVDTGIYSAYFTILTNSGGGFLINSAIPMFSTTIPFTTAPVTQLVRFQNLIFKNTHAGSGHYVLDDAKFLRTSFIGCTFWSIQCLYAPTVYTQSIYFDNCNMRFGSNQFFTSSVVSYDIKVHNCLCEAGGEWFHLVGAVGCSFVQNTMEGSTTSAAIVIEGGNGLEVSGNYFEANAIDLDFNLGSHLGHSVTGNYFAPPTGNWSIYWGVNASCVSKGNYCTGNLHNLASVTNIDINDYALGTVASKDYNTPIFGELIAPKTSGEVYSLGSAEILALDNRSILVGTDFANINLGTTGGTAIITIACTGIQPGVNNCSQIGEWFVTRAGTGAVTLTSKQSQSTGVAPVTAATSGDSIILTYAYAGAAACLYKTSIKVAGVTGSGVAGQYPTITIL